MTTYTIEIRKPAGEPEYIPMQGTRTDNGARRRMTTALKAFIGGSRKGRQPNARSS